jgi:hypothetical protein
MTPAVAEAFDSALEASMSGRPVLTTKGVEIVSPDVILRDFVNLYEVDEEFEAKMKERIAARMKAMDTSAAAERRMFSAPGVSVNMDANKGIMEAIMSALTSATEATGRNLNTVRRVAAGRDQREAILRALLGGGGNAREPDKRANR